MIRNEGQSAAIKLTHVSLAAGWWVSVDLDSQYKIVWGETRAHGVPIHEKKEKRKFKTGICIIIPTPIISD